MCWSSSASARSPRPRRSPTRCVSARLQGAQGWLDTIESGNSAPSESRGMAKAGCMGWSSSRSVAADGGAEALPALGATHEGHGRRLVQGAHVFVAQAGVLPGHEVLVDDADNEDGSTDPVLPT